MLHRNVEIYQWIRTYTYNKESDTYEAEYQKIWAQQLIDSSEYDLGHQNDQDSMPFSSESFYGDIRIGDFSL